MGVDFRDELVAMGHEVRTFAYRRNNPLYKNRGTKAAYQLWILRRLERICLEWEPALEHAAYLLLFAIGGEFLLEKVAGVHIGELVQFSISVCILLLAVIFARVRMLKPVLVIFTPWMVLFAAIQGALALIFSALKLQQREVR